jgi:hypothetical protein
MKKLIVLVTVICSYSAIYAQLGVNATGAAPISSAQLDVASTSKAFYPPRMTTAEKNAIAGKQAGAMVYDINLGALSFYNGSAWVSTAPTLSGATYTIGQNAQGGRIFWLDATGQHGLAVSLVEQADAVWYNGNTNTKAIRLGVYGGADNTQMILNSHGYGSFAAKTAAEYNGGAFGDWYLPAYDELNLLVLSGQGSLSGIYWSSTEEAVATGLIATQAKALTNAGAPVMNNLKSNSYRVRAIRKF